MNSRPPESEIKEIKWNDNFVIFSILNSKGYFFLLIVGINAFGQNDKAAGEWRGVKSLLLFIQFVLFSVHELIACVHKGIY